MTEFERGLLSVVRPCSAHPPPPQSPTEDEDEIFFLQPLAQHADAFSGKEGKGEVQSAPPGV